MESLEQVELTAPTVEEAVILGLARLSLTREEVVIEILDEGSRGFLGLGAREAHVRLTAKPPVPVPPPAPVAPRPVPQARPEPPAAPLPPAREVRPDQPAAPAPQAVVDKPAPQPRPEPPAVLLRPKPAAKAVSADVLDRTQVAGAVQDVAAQLLAGLTVQPQISWREEDERPLLWLDIRGKDSTLLVGNRAKTLDNLQYLFRLLVRRLADGDYDLVVDADGYRDRRRRKIQSLARKTADRAVSSGRSVHMPPMPAQERRLIHMFLRDDPRVKTSSDGKGAGRAVTVIPVTAEDA